MLHLLGGYLPDHTTGTVQRVRGLMLPLVRTGKCEVHILRPNAGENDQGTEVDEAIDGIRVRRRNGSRLSPIALRKVLSSMRFDLIHCHGVWDAAIGRLAGRKLPTIAEIHTLWPTGPIKTALYALSYKLSDRVLVLAPSMEAAVERLYGLPPRKVVMVPNGVDTTLFRPSTEQREGARAELSIRESSVVGFVGAFQPWQGLEPLIESFKVLVDKGLDTRLLLVGDGPHRPQVEGRVRDLGLSDHVTITGLVAQDKVSGYLNCIDVFVAARPSMLQTETATPLKLLEAMSAGRAVVASSVEGMSSVVEDGRTARLIPPGDTKRLTDAIEELLGDERARLRMGEAARQFVQRNFTWERSSEILLSTYRQALAGR